MHTCFSIRFWCSLKYLGIALVGFGYICPSGLPYRKTNIHSQAASSNMEVFVISPCLQFRSLKLVPGSNVQNLIDLFTFEDVSDCMLVLLSYPYLTLTGILSY